MADADATPKEISRAEAREMLANGAQLVDVRADHAWETGHIPGAVHIQLAEGAVGWEEEGLEFEPEGGYVAESGEAAAILAARKRSS